ncbi:Hypothetical predicted protein [Olea europaea subsp. europaea]|uniref:Uncharacterized protein n=1 Tax=Olea europaea subsp. europaea TaxID=158383 RepID=A0A8S0RM94_OLEEU|nr:Hypothetical predicted protein [Olea europaea subsp. europaea]
MGKKRLLRLFGFFLVLAFIFSSIAVLASRSFKEITENLWDQDSHYQIQAALDLQRKTVRVLEEEESFIQGRMDIERKLFYKKQILCQN